MKKNNPLLIVNGREVKLDLRAVKENLLYFLRDTLDLTGAKRGCGIGVCGSCTVLADDRPIRACRLRVGDVIGKRVLTIEGLAAGRADALSAGRADALHPLQRCFIEAGAIQCGYCTPGMVLTAHALLLRQPRPTRLQIRQAIAANLCRCTGYQQIIDAIAAAANFYPSPKKTAQIKPSVKGARR